MARGRRARKDCKCGTIFVIGETINDKTKLICPNCKKTKFVLTEKVPAECQVAKAAETITELKIVKDDVGAITAAAPETVTTV